MYYVAITLPTAQPEDATTIISGGFASYAEAAAYCKEKVKETGNTNYCVVHR